MAVPEARRPEALDGLAWAAGLGLLLALGLAAWRLSPFMSAGLPRVFVTGGVQALRHGALLGAGIATVWLLLPRGALPGPPRLPEPARWLLPALLLVAFAALEGAALRLAAAPRPPSIVVILVDVLRADHLGCYGYSRATSPHIDRLARDAVLFRRALAPSTFTKTSVASLFTGLHPHHHGVYRGDRPGKQGEGLRSDALAPELRTLAESLREAGLWTAAWVENAQLRAYMGFDQGFLDYHDQPGAAPRILASHRRWRRRLGRVDPTFEYLHLLDLHGPYRPKKGYRGLFGTHAPEWASLDSSRYRALAQAGRAGELEFPPGALEQLVADYDAELRYVDDHVGQLLDRMRAESRYDDSLIVLTSDHGDAFMEHGAIAHSWVPYDELIHVPLIVKLPGSLHGGRRVEAQVQLVDLVPTLLEIAGAAVPEGLDGTSLAAFLGGDEGAPPARPFAISEFDDMVAVRSEGWKLIDRGAGGRELYDLALDPAEQHDRMAAAPPAAAPLLAVLEEVIRVRTARTRREVEVDPSTEEALRALGYLD